MSTNTISNNKLYRPTQALHHFLLLTEVPWNRKRWQNHFTHALHRLPHCSKDTLHPNSSYPSGIPNRVKTQRYHGLQSTRTNGSLSQASLTQWRTCIASRDVWDGGKENSYDDFTFNATCIVEGDVFPFVLFFFSSTIPIRLVEFFQVERSKKAACKHSSKKDSRKYNSNSPIILHGFLKERPAWYLHEASTLLI